MLAKLLLIILVSGSTALALLVNRQHRLDAAHEMSLVHGRLLEQERTIWTLRGDVARRSRPAEVRRLVQRIGGRWDIIPARGQPAPAEPPARLVARDPDDPLPPGGHLGG